jgi:hypothetical protein
MFKCLINCLETLLVELVLDASTGSDHWFICRDPVLKLCQRWFPKEAFFGGWRRTTFGDLLGCREVGDDIGLLSASRLGQA